MHEYGIAQEIVNAIEEYVKKNKGCKPLSCQVQVGALTGINPEALDAAFPMAVKGTIAENTEIMVSIEQITCRCRNCGEEIRIDEFIDLLICENCGSSDIDHPPSAQKIFLKKLEVEMDGKAQVIEFEDSEIEEGENHSH